MKKLSKKGFTIVELVIVIAVIAILAGVLIPTFSSIINSAHASAAQSQAKSGLDAVLALTNGSLPENTVFYVNDNADAKIDYCFKFEKQALKQGNIDDNLADDTPLYASGKYVVYVTYDCFKGDDNTAKNAAITKVQDLIKDATGDFVYVSASDKWDATHGTPVSGGAMSGTIGTAGSAIDVYYCSDIHDTMVVFLANP